MYVKGESIKSRKFRSKGKRYSVIWQLLTGCLLCARRWGAAVSTTARNSCSREARV